jgi:hypothetical protein
VKSVTRCMVGAVMVASLVTSCSDDSEDGASSTTPAAEASTTTSSDTTTTRESAAGEIASELFSVPFTVVPPPGWTNPTNADEVFILVPPGSVESSEFPGNYLTALNFYMPFADTPELLLEEINASASFTVSAPIETQVGNMPATRVDVEGNDPTATLFLVNSGTSVGLYAGNSGSVYVVDVEGSAVAVLVEAPTESFDAFAAEAEAVLATVEF